MANMEIWNKVNKPPKTALRTINAGRLKGMSDINPQWRLQIMTDVFGQVGIGWYYEIVKTWTEQGASGELMAFVQVHLFTKTSDGWSAPIAGIGGNGLVQKESSGLRANDEAYKMALTDALSVAMKQLGVASAIYEGLWDGSKYKDEPQPPKAPNLQPPPLSAEELSDAIKAMDGVTDMNTLKGIYEGAYARATEMQRKALVAAKNLKKSELEKAA